MVQNNPFMVLNPLSKTTRVSQYQKWALTIYFAYCCPPNNVPFGSHLVAEERNIQSVFPQAGVRNDIWSQKNFVHTNVKSNTIAILDHLTPVHFSTSFSNYLA